MRAARRAADARADPRLLHRQDGPYAIPRYVEFVDELPKTARERNQYATLKARGITPETWDREQAGYQLKRQERTNA